MIHIAKYATTLFLLVIGLAPVANAQYASVTGSVRYPSGAAPVNAKVCFTLLRYEPNIPRISGTAILTQQRNFCVNADTNGEILTNLARNDVITPANTQWRVDHIWNGRQQHSAVYTVNTATLDLDTATPSSETVTLTTGIPSIRIFECNVATAATTWTCTHSLLTQFVGATVYSSATPPKLIVPDDVEATSTSVTTITFVVATAGRAVIIGGVNLNLDPDTNAIVANPNAAQAVVGDFTLTVAELLAGRVNKIRYVDGTLFPQTRAGIQAAIDNLPARGGIVVIPAPFALDGTTLTVGANGAGDPDNGKSVMLYFANYGAWSGTASPMFLVAGRSGITGLGRSTYLQNTGASGARLIDIAHGSEAAIIRDLGLLSKGPAIKCQGSCTGTKWSNLFVQAESGNSIETQSWLDTAEASGIFISHQSATGSCWRMGVTGTGGSLEWGINGASIRDVTCQTAVTGAGPSIHFESDGATPNTYGSGIVENIQILNARKEALKVRGIGPGPFRISEVKIGSPSLDAGTYDAITIANTGASLSGITLEGVHGFTSAYRYAIDWTSGDGRIKQVDAGATTAVLNVSSSILLEDIATVVDGIRATSFSASATAATAGGFRLGNNQALQGRDTTNTTNFSLAQVDSANQVLLGGTLNANTVLKHDNANATGRVGVQGRFALEIQTSFADAATTPSVAAGNFWSAANTAPTTITNFINGVAGQIIYVYFTNGNTTIQNNTDILLAGAVNFVGTADDVLTLWRDATKWREISRSVN